MTRPVCPCRTALFAMCKRHANDPHSASPLRGHPTNSPPPRVLTPPLTGNVTALAGPAAVEPAAARPNPGGGRRKLPRTKELSANDAGSWGERGRPGPGARASSPLPQARAQVETPRGGQPPGRSRPRARPGKRRLFRRGRAPLAAL